MFLLHIDQKKNTLGEALLTQRLVFTLRKHTLWEEILQHKEVSTVKNTVQHQLFMLQ